MKFALNILLKGKYCFLFTPLLMAILIISVKFFGVNGQTELPEWLSLLLDARYSEQSFILPLFVGFILSILVSIIFENPKLSHIEKIRLGKFYDGLAYVIRNLFLFFTGWLVAWSFGSLTLDFIKPLPQQEAMIPGMLILTVLCNYFIIKFKHNKVKGKAII